ncbi:MAG: VOC family protein, partial [Rhizobiales bacterium]|nr:VOC family protein [Hyphomicrobiales bacterium]
MSPERPVPAAKLTVVTLGVSDMRRSIAFYGALGFARRMRATGEEVAFFETGGAVLALYSWSRLAADAALADRPRPQGFCGMTLAWNCASEQEVDAVLAFAVAQGATLITSAHRTDYG